MDQSRREFVKTCACLGIAGAAMWVGVGCDYGGGDDGGDPGPSGNSCDYTVDDQGRVVLDLTQCTHLEQEGTSIFLRDTPQGTILVTHTAGGNYRALSARCTHQGCTVAASSPTLNCPCHGSKFDLNGAVVNGPATRPLTSWNVIKFENLLTISFE